MDALVKIKKQLDVIAGQISSAGKEYPYRTLSSLDPMSEITLKDLQDFFKGQLVQLKEQELKIGELEKEVEKLEVMYDLVMAELKRQVGKVRDEILVQVLLEEESEGFVDFVQVDFKDDLSWIASQNNARVNINTGSCTIESGTSQFVEPGYSTIRVLTNNVLTLPGTSIDSINGAEGVWQGIVSLRAQQEVKASIELDVLKEDRSINLISLNGLTGNGIINVYAQIKNAWVLIEENVAWAENVTVISSDLSSNLSKVRIDLAKDEFDFISDSREFNYLFNLKSIYLGSSVVDSNDNTCTITSKNIQSVPYRKVAIEACDKTSNSASIGYSISSDNSTWTAINPSNKEPNGLPYVVELGSLQNKSSISVNSYHDEDLGPGEVALYEDGFGLVNFFIPSSDAAIVNNNSIIVGAGFANAKSQSSIAGWKETETSLMTNIYSEVSRVINTGTVSIKVNSESRSGEISIPAGWNKIEIKKEDYSFSTFGASSINEIATLDALYPYNMKHIFEGYEYSGDFNNEGIYQGFPMRCADFLDTSNSKSSISNNEFYSETNESGNIIFYVKRQENDSLNNFFVSYNTSEDKLNSLYIRAILSSEDTNLSPVLTSITVKTGY